MLQAREQQPPCRQSRCRYRTPRVMRTVPGVAALFVERSCHLASRTRSVANSLVRDMGAGRANCDRLREVLSRAMRVRPSDCAEYRAEPWADLDLWAPGNTPRPARAASVSSAAQRRS